MTIFCWLIVRVASSRRELAGPPRPSLVTRWPTYTLILNLVKWRGRVLLQNGGKSRCSASPQRLLPVVSQNLSHASTISRSTDRSCNCFHFKNPFLYIINPFLPVEKKKISEISRKWPFRNFLLPLRYLAKNSFLVVTTP